MKTLIEQYRAIGKQGKVDEFWPSNLCHEIVGEEKREVKEDASTNSSDPYKIVFRDLSKKLEVKGNNKIIANVLEINMYIPALYQFWIKTRLKILEHLGSEWTSFNPNDENKYLQHGLMFQHKQKPEQIFGFYGLYNESEKLLVGKWIQQHKKHELKSLLSLPMISWWEILYEDRNFFNKNSLTEICINPSERVKYCILLLKKIMSI